jgi:3-methyladenine DNA glycosylase AlkD
MEKDGIIVYLRSLRNPGNIAGQLRFGITPKTEHLGIGMPVLRGIARAHRRDHALALGLWASGIHEARILAAHVDDPFRVTALQMEAWARDFDSWDVCDQVCGNLFDRTPLAVGKAALWSGRSPEFVKRAGFALMATLAWHREDLPDRVFRGFLPLIRREASDDRNFVRKAVNWALRQIGKRNPALRRAAIAEARRIQGIDSRSARWIAADALRDLQS